MRIFILSILKLLTYSNLFVSICVAAFTHLTYIIYRLPQKNLITILLMVFCFTFFTYNIQRLFRLKKKLLLPEKIGSRLRWVIKYKNPLTFFAVLLGLIGFGCTYFIHPNSWIIIIPMGIMSIFYVVPIIPFYAKSPTLRNIPYLKLIVIGLVWSLIIVWLPMIDSQFSNSHHISLLMALSQNFLFVIAITLPFDIRDIEYDKTDKIKTIPLLIGVKKTIILAEFLLICSASLLFFLCENKNHFYGLLIGHVITMIIIAYSDKERKELFFAGLVESSVLVLYVCGLISEYCFFL